MFSYHHRDQSDWTLSPPAIEAPEGGDVRLPHSQVCVPVKHTAYNVDDDDDDCDDDPHRLQCIAM